MRIKHRNDLKRSGENPRSQPLPDQGIPIPDRHYRYNDPESPDRLEEVEDVEHKKHTQKEQNTE